MNENRFGFWAGLAGGFGFYVASMLVAGNWETATWADAAIKVVIQLALGLVVGILLYLGVYFLVNRKREVKASKRITRTAIWGIIAGLVIAFFFGMLFYNPTGIGPEPLFRLDPLFPLDN